MTTLNISNTDAAGAGLVVETWARGAGGQPDALVELRTLGAGTATLAVDATHYLVVREADGSDAKAVDNWSQAPAPAADA